MTNPKPVRLRYQLAMLVVFRMVLNTSFRMIYAFLPVFARGLGVSLDKAALAVTVRSGAALIGPVLGTVADARGRRYALLLGMLLSVSGGFFIGIWPTYVAFVIGLILNGTGKIIVDAGLQAYIGDNIPFSQRGRAIGIAEMGWSAAFLVGMPFIGWMIAKTTWVVPFPVTAGLGLALILVLIAVIPNDIPPETNARKVFVGSAQTILKNRGAMAALIMAFFVGLANEVVSITYGAWLEISFGLTVAALGVAASIIGLSELSGEGLIATLSDRIGKRALVALGLSGGVITSLVLPLADAAIAYALIWLFMFYISFEVSLVGSLTLVTELTPTARATLISAFIAAISAGRMIGAVVGPWLFDFGMTPVSAAAAGVNLSALLIMMFFVKVEQDDSPSVET